MRRMLVPVLALIASAAFAQPQYEVVDLTKIYGQGFQAVSISDSGVIGGNYSGRACIAYDGKLTMLPSFKGDPWVFRDLGDNGDVLGVAPGRTWNLSVYFDAEKGTVVDMGIYGTAAAPARGINGRGQATGQLVENFIGLAFVWKDGTVTQTFEPAGAGSDISESGTVVGHSGLFASMWVESKYQNLHPKWADRSYAVAVNANNEAVGTAFLPGVSRALLWRDGQVIDLGNLGTQVGHAVDINDQSQVVGVSGSQAFFWEKGAMHRLEDLVPGGTGFASIESVESINNSGQVIAVGHRGTVGNSSSLLFQPVPEPTSGVVLACLSTMICVRRFAVNRRCGVRRRR